MIDAVKDFTFVVAMGCFCVVMLGVTGTFCFWLYDEYIAWRKR